MTADDIVMHLEDFPDLIPNDSDSLHIELGDFSDTLDAEDSWVCSMFQLFQA